MSLNTIMWLPLVLSALLVAAEANIIVYTQDIPHIIEEEFRDLPAAFGGDLPDEGLRALLVVGSPEDGCTALAKPPTVDNFTGRWAVLVARYNCSFVEKVRAAQAAGYALAIVHNVNSNDLETMSANSSDDIVIPSVFISENAGGLLASQYTYTDGFYIMVNGDLPFNINTHLLLPFAIIVALCLLVMIIFMIVKCIKDRRRARRHRLPSRALSKIPICKFSKGDPYDTCAVCLDDYVEGERLRVLPCAHAYHAKCIDPWLTENRRVCPVCKRRVCERRDRGSSHSDSDSDTPLPTTQRITQGGTFEPQSENPFVRAARFMLRRSRLHQEISATDSSDEENAEQEETRDSAPLIPAPTLENERRPARRARRRPRGPVAPPDTEAPPQQASPSHSINQDQEVPGGSPPAAADPPQSAGEIGVAALPAPPDLSATHIRL